MVLTEEKIILLDPVEPDWIGKHPSKLELMLPYTETNKVSELAEGVETESETVNDDIVLAWRRFDIDVKFFF